jgi:hypothetical protein
MTCGASSVKKDTQQTLFAVEISAAVFAKTLGKSFVVFHCFFADHTSGQRQFFR